MDQLTDPNERTKQQLAKRGDDQSYEGRQKKDSFHQ